MLASTSVAELGVAMTPFDAQGFAIKTPKSSERLLEIDALRGIAALMVVLFHYTTRFGVRYAHAARCARQPSVQEHVYRVLRRQLALTVSGTLNSSRHTSPAESSVRFLLPGLPCARVRVVLRLGAPQPSYLLSCSVSRHLSCEGAGPTFAWSTDR